jgi:DDE superfamily endonuclease
MYHTTGFAKDEIIDLCALVYANEENCDIDPWPPSLGLYKSVIIALTYMRRNRVQQELAETYNTSQPTISRANSRITSRLAIVLAPFVPTAEDLDPGTQYIYDGTLLPCWSWREHRELYSGKRKTTGKNVQVACNLYGELAWISDPVDGSRHDAHCIDESSVLAGFPNRSQIGDKGYVGKRMITPIRKPECRDLLDWEKEFNTRVNKIRYMIEQVIANFKAWRIMHTDYRRPLDTFDTTISAVVGLHFYRMA